MNDECIICKAPLEYLEKDEEMECAICHKKENSKMARAAVLLLEYSILQRYTLNSILICR